MAIRQTFKKLADRLSNDTFADFTKTFIIEKPTKVSAGRGSFDITWATFATINKGFVFNHTANKKILDDHIQSIETKRFEFEFIAGITPDMRVNYNGAIYNMMPAESILDNDIWVTIVATKGLAT